MILIAVSSLAAVYMLDANVRLAVDSTAGKVAWNLRIWQGDLQLQFGNSGGAEAVFKDADMNYKKAVSIGNERGQR